MENNNKQPIFGIVITIILGLATVISTIYTKELHDLLGTIWVVPLINIIVTACFV
jgi:hypothetical protein